jgi:hypothetical protein
LLNVAFGLLTELSREGVAAIIPKSTSFIPFGGNQPQGEK